MGQEEVYNPNYHPDIPDDSPLVIENSYTGETYVEDRSLRLKKQLYATHEAIRDHNFIKLNGQPRPGFEKWGDNLRKYIALRDLERYPKLEPKGARKAGNVMKYKVWAWPKICRSGPGVLDVKLSWELAPPTWEPTDTGRVRERDTAALRLAGDTLHDAKFPSIPQRKRGRNGAPALHSELPTASGSGSAMQSPGNSCPSTASAAAHAPANDVSSAPDSDGSDGQLDGQDDSEDEDYDEAVEARREMMCGMKGPAKKV
ncbi:hypothetical protein LTR85_011070 [Meristemomyces frigidus]|nr:hypothetical protein LTR85_011070 [Meristemomyces frigidus]